MAPPSTKVEEALNSASSDLGVPMSVIGGAGSGAPCQRSEVAASTEGLAVSLASNASGHGSARKASSYFDWTGILAGEVQGQALPGARRHLATLVDDSRAHQKLDTEIRCFPYVRRLAPDKIEA